MVASSANLHLLSTCLLLLFLLLVISTSVESQSIVRYLPGYEGLLPFELETGYVSIDGTDDMHLFYYFVKSENNPADDPLIFWNTGGPYCSGLTALFFEFGPLQLKKAEYDGNLPTLVLNPHSWTKMSNIIFVDSPVGTGFSYSRSLEDLHLSDTKSAYHASTFIKKWLATHPKYLSNPLYIGGDSYAGIIVPIIVKDLSDGIEGGNEPPLNLKGYVLGNPVTDPDVARQASVQYAHGMGLISDELFEIARKSCRENYVNVDPKNVLCVKSLEDVTKCTSRLNSVHILEPRCVLVTPRPNKVIKYRYPLEETLDRNIYSPPEVPELQCRSYGYMLSYYWANDDRVRKALGIRKGTVPEWVRCIYHLNNYSLDVKSAIAYHLNLSKQNYRSLIYNGDHDMLVTFVATQAWIRSLNFSISDEWRPWLVDTQVAGYTRTYTNHMTFATIKGGGHTAPEYRPKECLAMLERWLSHEPL